jgi:hypothetical protein
MENDSSKRGVGRPKARPQTGPLVLEGGRVRAKLELELGEETAAELKEYARWVEMSSSLATGDAFFTTVDFALRELFRRDRLWQARRRKGAQPESPSGSSTPLPSIATSTLPPPAVVPRSIPSPAAPSGVR